MTTTDKISAAVGDTLTVLGAITLPDPERGDTAAVRQRGYVFTLTDALYEASKNRYGVSVFDDISSSSQIKNWGTEKLVLGDCSDEILWWQGDASSTKLARDSARENAHKIADPEERAVALQEVHDTFGSDRGASGQVTLLRVAADRDPHTTRDARS